MKRRYSQRDKGKYSPENPYTENTVLSFPLCRSAELLRERTSSRGRAEDGGRSVKVKVKERRLKNKTTLRSCGEKMHRGQDNIKEQKKWRTWRWNKVKNSLQCCQRKPETKERHNLTASPQK